MTVYRKISGTWKAVTPYRKVGGVWKSCIMWRKVGGVWKQLNSFMTASASPGLVAGSTTSGSTVVVTSNSTTCTPSGGAPGYTYSWAQVGGDTMTIDSPTASSTTFSKSVGNGATFVGYFVCTVTDSLGATAATNTVECQLSND